MRDILFAIGCHHINSGKWVGVISDEKIGGLGSGYGVISYSVVQRTREIGIRAAALGANPRNILGPILRSAMALMAFGLLLGLAGALGLSQFLSSMLFNIGKYDAETFVAVAGLLALVTLLACLVPARRAMKVNPIVALKCE